MFLTVCIPTYNRGYIISRALYSLENQTISDFEAIIVDDGSYDDTEKIVKDFLKRNHNWTYIKKSNGGKHTALNIGIQKAEGDYFLIMDSDNYLESDCVYKLKKTINSKEYIESDESLCGVIGKCRNIRGGEIIGALFQNTFLSYIDIHFFNKGIHYGDCCECIKTDILKKYRWPEDKRTKFVPESYVFDQIGLKYKVFAINDVLEYFEYMEDGITQQVESFQKRNSIGYLYGYVSTLDYIFRNINVPMMKKVSMWRLYWNSLKICTKLYGGGVQPKVKNITPIGIMTLIFLPILNKIKR
ncbi:MAG: glycosyltransferase family 2 protein [Dorea sp.]|nr:glycosyltransferase family 2 protein [Dorea sp.]